MNSFLSKPYAERQIIVICPEDEEEAKSSIIDWNEFGNATRIDWTKFGRKMGADWKVAGIDIKKLATKSANFCLKYSPYTGPYYWMIHGTKTGIKKIYKRFHKNNFDFNRLLFLTCEKVSSEISFPVGHPLIDFCYVGHPILPNCYFPVASFHNVLFEEKVNELVTLIASLGAKRLKVRCIQGYKSSAGISFIISEPQSSSKVGAETGYNKESWREGIFEETYFPTEQPKIPDGLVWFKSEPTWQALAERRLKFNTQTFRIQLAYKEDYGINTSLTLGLEKCGVKLGGSFTKFEATLWEFEGDFSRDIK